jgi:hypothetical protein
MQFPLVGSSYTSQSILADDSRTMNWYVEAMESKESTTPAALYPTPGLSVFATLPLSPVRGLMTQNSRTFAVGGTGAYEVDSLGVVTGLGTVLTDSNPATLSTNGPAGHQVFVTSGTKGYIYDLNNAAFTLVLTGVTMGAFLDGYFLGLDAPTSTLKLSALEDGTTWSGSAQRNTAGDKWQAMLISHRLVWLFGSQRTDVWTNTGAASFPLAPVDGAFLEQGIAAPFSAVEVDNAPMWLGANENGFGIVWRANGFTAQRTSTHAVELAIQSYSTISDAVGWAYQDQGHSFYVLNFPTAGATWVWDAATNQWHERGAWAPNSMMYTAYRPQCHAYAFGQHLVGDRTTGSIYTMSIANQYEADGAAIRRLRRSPTLISEMSRLFVPELQVHLEPGLGTQSGQGTTPTVLLRQSIDGGKTWGNERAASAGAVGDYRKRVIYRRNAAGRMHTFEITVTDPVPWRLVSGFAVVEKGSS